MFALEIGLEKLFIKNRDILLKSLGKFHIGICQIYLGADSIRIAACFARSGFFPKYPAKIHTAVSELVHDFRKKLFFPHSRAVHFIHKEKCGDMPFGKQSPQDRKSSVDAVKRRDDENRIIHNRKSAFHLG